MKLLSRVLLYLAVLTLAATNVWLMACYPKVLPPEQPAVITRESMVTWVPVDPERPIVIENCVLRNLFLPSGVKIRLVDCHVDGTDTGTAIYGYNHGNLRVFQVR